MDSHSGAVVEMYHETGFDAIMIDREHTALNSETIREHIRLARALEIPCMVRAADNSYHEVCRFLDQGADGFFMPRIRSRQEAEACVANVKYPTGERRCIRLQSACACARTSTSPLSNQSGSWSCCWIVVRM
jgi:2-keto-3-deoxy-L-rhamnonate aldolase RhmA